MASIFEETINGPGKIKLISALVLVTTEPILFW